MVYSSWTLQELIAPASVEFFSSEGQRLGDKKSLELLVHEITSIPVKVLQGSPLVPFTFDERMSWAAKRTTKRKEDEAYCLFGIFDIQMPLIYGEGRERAFIRLEEEADKRSKVSNPTWSFILCQQQLQCLPGGRHRCRPCHLTETQTLSEGKTSLQS